MGPCRLWSRLVSVHRVRLEPRDTPESARERAEVAQGVLPARYAEPWAAPFLGSIETTLPEATAILDVGSGASPAIGPTARPAGSEYVGLDISAAELGRAPAGSYDRTVVADVARRLPDLEGAFDLVISWQVLEHVRPLKGVLDNLYAYLRPGGRMVAQLSNTFSIYALISRVVPHRLSSLAMQRLLGADPADKFPAHYDRCYYGALRRLLDGWSDYEIIPRYKGGAYFRFSRVLLRTYLVYENWTYRNGHRNLATHYVVTAVR